MAARKRQAARRNWPDNLYQNSAGYFWFRHPGTKKTFGLGKDFKIAASKVRAVNAELARRREDTSLLDRLDETGMTLASWCDTFEEKYKADPDRKPATLKTVHHQLNAIRKATFAKKPIGDVTTLDISSWIGEMAKEHPTMASLVLVRVRTVFRAAEAQGHIGVGKNPAAPTDKPKVVVTRARLTLDDFNAILNKARENEMRWLENVLLLALVTGQRREDLVKMTFSQIRDGYLWVTQSKGKKGHAAKLMIPTNIVLPAIKMSIDDVVRQCRDQVISKHVIHHIKAVGRSKPGRPLTLDSLSEVFAQYRDLAEIQTPPDKTPTSFHEIRSLAARLYAEAYGEDFAQAMLGHKSGRMTALYRDSRGQEWQEVKLKAS
ncbi:enterobacteria phage integrase [Burkholderia multivorans]